MTTTRGGLKQELRSLLPSASQVATLLTMIVVDPADPAFASPTKFVGPVYTKEAADALADKGWAFRQDGAAWRRVVPSPEPQRILEIEPIGWLLERGAVVICAGGGGIPTMYPSSAPGELVGVEAVIDKDLAGELLAEDVGADLYLMATDVDGVYVRWGTPEQERLSQVTPEDLAGYQFPAGSMGPKVEAASPFCRENRQAGRDRLTGRHRRDRSGNGRHERGRAGRPRAGARPGEAIAAVQPTSSPAATAA